ncbi:spore germination protein [Peribacillus muralis]|uniref:spore germination protein n=1 Tax=Peribacillus muralis TaxID=264697 RepID=UPI001F4D9745|nr:spore germination protein [Peribacillus muralis]MCK1995286.1 spore germination protein [Peribacillus muralis]MCK2015958.1 spore germination protein [Peribacillus muralis]
MFRKRNNQNDAKESKTKIDTVFSIEVLKSRLVNMEDAVTVDTKTNKQVVTLLYIKTMIDHERLNESILRPLINCSDTSFTECIHNSEISQIHSLEEAELQILSGSILLYSPIDNKCVGVHIDNPLSRAIESSETETVLLGPKDSFSEKLENNITLIRRRLPLTELKTESFMVGTVTKTKVVMMYIEGIANPDLMDIARKKISAINFDVILDSSHVAAFMEDHYNSVFPQYQQTDRPDMAAYSLAMGKLVIVVNNTPFVLIAPITFFHLFQSPDDYIQRWIVASLSRVVRYVSFVVSIILIPFYVALSTYHYQMIPLPTLYVLIESRSKLPLTPFWEALLMLITLEIIKEASLRMPTKTGQTLGVIGGIVIGDAAVQAGFASKVLIVLVGISAISSFLVPNYAMTRSNVIIQFIFLVFAEFLGIVGITVGMILLLAHLNKLSSLEQPYFAPVSPFIPRDWLDLFIRGPFRLMKKRPKFSRPLNQWRYSRRR